MIKKFLLSLVILFFSVSIVYGEPKKSYGLRWDRMLHWHIGFSSSIILTQWQKKWLDREEDYGIISIGFPLILGITKEYKDHKTLNFTDNRWGNDGRWDVVAFVVGAICGKFMTYTF